MRTNKQWVLYEVVNLTLWIIIFGAIYWLATDNLWLCFFITISVRLSLLATTSTEIKDNIIKLIQKIEGNFLQVKNDSEEIESELEELRIAIKKLKARVDDLEFMSESNIST